MNLGRVCGQVVSTRKSENLTGFKILIVQPISLDTFEEKGAPVVSIDTIGAGEGEVVMMVSGSSARQTAITDAKPTDNSIVAIIDSVDILGKRVFDKGDPSIVMKEEEPEEIKDEAPMADAVPEQPEVVEEEPEEAAEEPEAIEEETAEAIEEEVVVAVEEAAEEPEEEPEKEELKLFIVKEDEKLTKAQAAAVKKARKLIEQKLAEKEDAEK